MTKGMEFTPVGVKCNELNPKALMLLATATCAGFTKMMYAIAKKVVSPPTTSFL